MLCGLRRSRDIAVWHLQLAYVENFREKKQSVNTARTEDGGTERLSGEKKRRSESMTEKSGSLKLGQRQNEQC